MNKILLLAAAITVMAFPSHATPVTFSHDGIFSNVTNCICCNVLQPDDHLRRQQTFADR